MKPGIAVLGVVFAAATLAGAPTPLPSAAPSPSPTLAPSPKPAPATAPLSPQPPSVRPPASPPGQARAPELRRSGFDDMGASTQALQRDDAQNPAMLWVQDGEQRFGTECRRCHDTAALRGLAARYPAWDRASAKPVTLAMRIDLCRQRQAGLPALAAESDALLGLEAYVALQSRGLPIAPPADPRLRPWRERGAALFNRRIGQLDFSCAQCHDDNAGRRLAGSPIPQGHPTAYPLYRLEWQGMGSLQRRLRNCMTGVRAEPYPWRSDEFTAIELHLQQRAAGMAVESPGVRP